MARCLPRTPADCVTAFELIWSTVACFFPLPSRLDAADLSDLTETWMDVAASFDEDESARCELAAIVDDDEFHM